MVENEKYYNEGKNKELWYWEEGMVIEKCERLEKVCELK